VIGKFFRTLALLFVGGAAFHAGGCSTNGGGGTNTNWVVCQTDHDCRANETCVEKRCTAQSGSSRSIVNDASPDGPGIVDTHEGGTHPVLPPSEGGSPDTCSKVQAHGAGSISAEFRTWGSLDANKVQLNGTVTAVAPGSASTNDTGTGFGSPGFSFRVDSGASGVFVSVTMPSSEPVVFVGETVSIDAEGFEYSTTSGPSGTLTVRDRNGALLLWISQGSALPTAPSGFGLTGSTQQCTWYDSCIVWRYEDFQVTSGSHQATLPVGGTVQIGAYEFGHDGGPIMLADSHKCTDDYTSEVAFYAKRTDCASCSADAGDAGSPISDSATKCAFSGQWVPHEGGSPTFCLASYDCNFDSPMGPPFSPPPPERIYNIQCAPADGGAVLCTCEYNESTVELAPRSTLPTNCGGADMLEACGFPRWIPPHP